MKPLNLTCLALLLLAAPLWANPAPAYRYAGADADLCLTEWFVTGKGGPDGRLQFRQDGTFRGHWWWPRHEWHFWDAKGTWRRTDKGLEIRPEGVNFAWEPTSWSLRRAGS